MSSDEITLLNQRRSHLLRLPGEIRNEIYKYVFGGSYIIIDHSRGGQPYTLLPGIGKTSCSILLALGQTSRQLRLETASKPLRFDKVRARHLAEDIGGMTLNVRRTVTHLYVHEMVHDLRRWRMLALFPNVKVVMVIDSFASVSPARVKAIRQLIRRVTGRNLRIILP